MMDMFEETESLNSYYYRSSKLGLHERVKDCPPSRALGVTP